MPRRTVQEVTVQDVQKRRSPSKHYVRPVLFKPSKQPQSDSRTEKRVEVYSVARLSFLSGKVKTKRVSSYSRPRQQEWRKKKILKQPSSLLGFHSNFQQKKINYDLTLT